MSLIVPQWGWSNCSSNLSGTPGLTPGTMLTSGGSANTDGTTSALITALGHDCEFLVLQFFNSGAGATNTNMLCDIMIDPAGGTTWSTDPIINDLMVGWISSFQSPNTGPRVYCFPFWVKSGASIGARIRAAQVSDTVQVVAYAYGGNSRPGSWWCGQSVTEIGIAAASSAGTAHTPGSSGVFSTWTNFGSTIPKPAGAIQFAVNGTSGDTALSNAQCFYEFGVNSTRIGPTHYLTHSSGETFSPLVTGPIFCNLALGAQLQVRATSSTTAEAHDVGAWVVH